MWGNVKQFTEWLKERDELLNESTELFDSVEQMRTEGYFFKMQSYQTDWIVTVDKLGGRWANNRWTGQGDTLVNAIRDAILKVQTKTPHSYS